MPKPNAFLAKMEARYRRDMADQFVFALQMGMDAAALAANEVFGAGPKRCVAFCEAYNRIVNEIAAMTNEDADRDREIEYTKARIDRALQRILGDAFHPWDERYRARIEVRKK